jgi:hypothetical protein
MASGSLNRTTILIPNRIDNIQITFLRRSASFHFYHVALEGKLVAKLREWIVAQKKVLEAAGKIEPYDPTRRQPISSLSLDGNPVWEAIKESLVSQAKQTLVKRSADLRGTNHSYYVSCRSKGHYFALGYRITPSYIMQEGGFFLTSTFKDLIQIKGVKLDESPAFLVSYDLEKGKCMCVIFDATQFEQLFDLFEYQKEQAQRFVETCLASLIDVEIANSVIQKSRQLVKMLNKPFVQQGNINTDIGYLSRVKEKTPGLAFEIGRAHV